MVKQIVKDPFFLGQKAEPATEADKPVIKDLLDTLKANEAECAGMAANMIGVNKSILAVSLDMLTFVMVNPVITKKDKPFESTEGCLSIPGAPKNTTRYFDIEVEYLDADFKPRKQDFHGMLAVIIQHEMDHFEGILI